MRNKSTGRDCDPKPFVPRKATSFEIGPNSHPRKVARWFAAGGGIILPAAKLAKAAARHTHPRIKRRA